MCEHRLRPQNHNPDPRVSKLSGTSALAMSGINARYLALFWVSRVALSAFFASLQFTGLRDFGLEHTDCKS